MNGIQPSSCVRARKWISLALDGELSDFERFLMKDHVGRCADCSAFESDAREFTAQVRSTPLEQLTVPVRVGWQRRRVGLARVGIANVVPVAVAAAAVFLGIAFLPERASVLPSNESTLQAAVDPMNVNELVLAVRLPNLEQQKQAVLPRLPRGLGTVKPPLAASPS
jgi:predicted anti-sigma-YlaC factor YlaD